MWLYILQGIGYGLAAAAQPGPFQTYLISHTLTKGWKRTLPAAFAPLVSDGPIIGVCLFLLSRLPAWFERFLYIAGGLFLLYLAYGAFRSWKYFDFTLPAIEVETRQSILKAALINTLNPNPYIFWSLVTGPILLAGWRETPSYGIGFAAGFYFTMILGFVVLIFVFGSARGFGPKFNCALLGITGLALFGFGMAQLWLGVAG